MCSPRTDLPPEEMFCVNGDARGIKSELAVAREWDRAEKQEEITALAVVDATGKPPRYRMDGKECKVSEDRELWEFGTYK